MFTQEFTSQKIAIIGAGFSGTSLAAVLHRLAKHSVEVFLFERSGVFGLGPAYSTPYPFHLLNVRAGNMSIFENDAHHFLNWLRENNKQLHSIDPILPLEEQFVPRLVYGKYLQESLQFIAQNNQFLKLHMIAREVIDVKLQKNQINQIKICTSHNQQLSVNQVILATGHAHLKEFPFNIHPTIKCIHNPWNYSLVEQISKIDPVLLVGTGLSMIDTILSLHQQKHRGKIILISRHGLLPLPHSLERLPKVTLQEELPKNLRVLFRFMRRKAEDYIKAGYDWQAFINSLREETPSIWQALTIADQKRFLRHLLPYWNIHRHRVHEQIIAFLKEQAEKKKIELLAGHIIETREGVACIRLRGSQKIHEIKIKWLINCMGPSLQFLEEHNTLINALSKKGKIRKDFLNLGLETDDQGALIDEQGQSSLQFFTVGPLRKASLWETNSVPEIRKQTLHLAKTLLNMNGENLWK